jgi:hypothetical protein
MQRRNFKTNFRWIISNHEHGLLKKYDYWNEISKWNGHWSWQYDLLINVVALGKNGFC